MRRRALALVLALACAGPPSATPFLVAPAHAVQPDEVLDDPALERRARDLSAGLRCMVCQNQSIDDSDAPLARDLRLLVRERLVEGDSDGEVLDYLVSRYGEFVLMRPRVTWATAALWGLPVVMLLGGAGFLVVNARRRSAAAGENRLSAEEEKRIADFLKRLSRN